jgi:tetratricopeptide (TPR) repeat protein
MPTYPRPAISVITPVFNGVQLLTRAVASVCRQTFADWELLLVDDASTDDSFALMTQLAEGDPRIRPLRRSHNGGPSATRNEALRQARGEMIAYLDHDDEFYPDYLEHIARNRQRGDVLVFAYDLIEERPDHPACGTISSWNPQNIRHLLQRQNVAVPLGVAHRRDLLDRVGLFDERILVEQDWELWKRFASAGATFVYLPQRSGLCHIRADSLSRTRTDALPLSPRLEAARGHIQAGAFAQGEQICRQILQVEPQQVEAWHLLGMALQGCGNHQGAIDAYQRALGLQPDSVEAHQQLAQVLTAQGRRREAITHYRHALRLRPNHAEVMAQLGLVLAEEGQRDEAVVYLRQATREQPDVAQTHQNLGVALAQQGRLAESVQSLERAMQLKPDYAEAHYNLGNVLQEMGRREEAITHFRLCLQIKPNHAGACNNLGLALTETGMLAEAVVVLQQATRLQPKMKEAHNNLGLAYADLGRFDEAQACYEHALRLDSGYAEAHSNLGNAYKEQGRLEEALACYQWALWLAPDTASTQYNRSLALLQKGDYQQGWPAYEWRWRRKRTRQRPFVQPRWEGEPLAEKTILLWCEQGLGDTIQFVRYAALAKQRVGQVILECPPLLLPLLSSCPGVDQVVAEGSPLPDFDVQAPLLSLPAVCGTTMATVPAEVPYLRVEQQRVEDWRVRLEAESGLRVGVVWRGNPHHPWDRHRSVPLVCLEPLARVEGVRFISLQKGPGREQIAQAIERLTVVDLGEQLDAEGGAFVDTAAVMQVLDLVVCVDTAAAHVAGALGVPVWVALSRIADWRWLLERSDTPWYPSMRFFRQSRLGDWQEVFERMAGELSSWCKVRRPGRIPVEVVPGELLDRLTILEIKSEHLTDPHKRTIVQGELAALQRAREDWIVPSEALSRLTAELRAVNEALWDSEDRLRLCEQRGDFGTEFIELARSIYRQNDRRSALKQKINELLGVPQGEPKVYADYQSESDDTND